MIRISESVDQVELLDSAASRMMLTKDIYFTIKLTKDQVENADHSSMYV